MTAATRPRPTEAADRPRRGPASRRAAAGGPTDKAAPLITPAVEIPLQETATPAADPLDWPGLRAAAHAMCAACEIKTQELRESAPEPAWSLIVHAAGETCAACSLPKVATICRGCPGVELVRRLLGQWPTRRPAEPA